MRMKERSSSCQEEVQWKMFVLEMLSLENQIKPKQFVKLILKITKSWVMKN